MNVLDVLLEPDLSLKKNFRSPCFMYKNSKKYEVIGNIHDNQELLGGE